MRYYDYSPMYYHSSFWPQGILSLILNLAFWAAIVWLLTTLFKHFAHKNESTCCPHGDCCERDNEGTENRYMDIVKERYAKGEIDHKQFEELKKDLSQEPSSPVSVHETKE